MILASHEQLSLDTRYAPGAAPTTTWTDELDVLREAVALLGLKDVCHELDANKTLVLDAMHERDRKHWQAEWTHVVIAMLARRADDLAAEVLRALVRARLGIVAAAFEIVAHDALTTEEAETLRRLEAKKRRAEAARKAVR